MLSRDEFISISLEINLFFQRIMKEHLYFIELNLQPIEAPKIAKANLLKRSFEQLLNETIYYANGNISEETIASNEFVTPYTLSAEKLTERLTGGNINTEITMAEMNLTYCPCFNNEDWLENVVQDLNKRSLCLLDEVIIFQKHLIDLQLECNIFINLYPEMLEHDTREAVYYCEILKAIANRKLPKREICDEFNFWNNIMAEHGQFVDGLLDPTEISLKEKAAAIAKNFERLVKECIRVSEKQILSKSLGETNIIRDFKETATKGLLECKIKSIIAPLLADHILREANHYLRLLRSLKTYC